MPESEQREWALLGAKARLKEIEGERQRIFAAFPQLRRESGSPDRQARSARRGGMSPEARRAASERMKAYWAKKGKNRRAMSPAAKRKMSAGMKRYWAERKAKLASA